MYSLRGNTNWILLHGVLSPRLLYIFHMLGVGPHCSALLLLQLFYCYHCQAPVPLSQEHGLKGTKFLIIYVEVELYMIMC